jgi:hypothetical protein
MKDINVLATTLQQQQQRRAGVEMQRRLTRLAWLL